MTDKQSKTVLIVTNSNIFFECIKKLLIFTLKTQFIQSNNYEMIIQYANGNPRIDLLVLDCRFREDLKLSNIEKVINSANKNLNIIIFVDSNNNLSSNDKVNIIKSDTTFYEITDNDGTYITQPKQNTRQIVDILTIKEKAIAKLISMGLNNKQIAIEQNISEKTVKAHLTNIYRKLNLNNRFELMLSANKTEQ